MTSIMLSQAPFPAQKKVFGKNALWKINFSTKRSWPSHNENRLSGIKPYLLENNAPQQQTQDPLGSPSQIRMECIFKYGKNRNPQRLNK